MLQKSHIRRYVHGVHSLEHPSFCFGTKDAMVWKGDIAQEVDALRKFTNDGFVRMEHETSFVPQPLPDEWQKPAELGGIV